MTASSLQDQGRRLLSAMHGAMRALKLYPLENEAVQQAIDELHAGAEAILRSEEGIEVRVVGEFFFLNDVRLRLDLSNFATFGNVGQTLQAHGIGTVEVLAGVGREEWAPFLSLLGRTPGSDPLQSFLGRLSETPVERIEVDAVGDHGDELEEEEVFEQAKRTYAQSVQVAKDVLGDVRLGKAVNARKVKRAVQGIVDQVLADEPSIVTMTTLRDFDEYTFTHCVNVCIFSVVMGQRLGLDRLSLYELGLGALLHDLGKMRLPHELVTKPGGLNDEEWEHLKEHPALGLLHLFQTGGYIDVPYRQMLMAYEHHMKTDLKGYPTNRRPREPGIFSRIVAVADGFDAATSVRSYQHKPWGADEVLREMRENRARGYDQLLVKALIAATGVFPIGTLVILDTYELAVVSKTNPDPEKLHLPTVKIISDPMGVPLTQPLEWDLSTEGGVPGEATRTILKTTDPQKYGIRVADYLI
ncbi:MAG: HD domain-containing protein [Longimicrobiales bacterium]|nr:HD domain-containing protein [Longimicrobiales bacterium]